MKKTIGLICFILLLIAMFSATAMADDWVARGVVIANRITMRETPKSNGKTVTHLTNGTMMAILDEDGSWYYVNADGHTGYVMKEYVVADPDFMTTTGSVSVYAYPGSDKRVGSLSRYTRLTIIDEYRDYYVVNLRHASGFIKKNASFMLDSEMRNARVLGTIEMTESVPARDGPSSEYPAVEPHLQAGSRYSYVEKSDSWYIIIIGDRIAYMWEGVCKEV